jgi:protein-disulfide isomerase-like protein with CxxC motif
VALLIRAWPLELVNDAPLDPDLIAEEVAVLRAHVAPDLFSGFDPASFPSTSLPPLALAVAANAVRPEVGERVGLALRWALFEEGRDISKPDVLLDIAASAGIALPTHCEVDRVRDDWYEGQQRGVVGSPHFFVGADGFFCPTLDVRRVDHELVVQQDRAGFNAFVDRIFVPE